MVPLPPHRSGRESSIGRANLSGQVSGERLGPKIASAEYADDPGFPSPIVRVQVDQRRRIELRMIRTLVGDFGDNEDPAGPKHARHLVQGASPVRGFRQVVDDPMGYHHIEAGIRERESPGVAGFDPNAIRPPLKASVLQGGIRRVAGLVLGPSEIDPHCRAASQPTRGADEHQPAAAPTKKFRRLIAVR